MNATNERTLTPADVMQAQHKAAAYPPMTVCDLHCLTSDLLYRLDAMTTADVIALAKQLKRPNYDCTSKRKASQAIVNMMNAAWQLAFAC